MFVIDLRRGFLGVEDTGEAECEAEMVGGGGKAGFAVGCSGGYSKFILWFVN